MANLEQSGSRMILQLTIFFILQKMKTEVENL